MRIALPHNTLAAATTRLNAHFFSAAMFLCVTVLVGVAASALFLREAMEAHARQLLAADLRLQASLPMSPGDPPGSVPTTVLTFAEQQLRGPGRRFSPGLEFSAMARSIHADRSVLVEVKAVATDYPLRGQLQLNNGMPLPQALAAGGAVVEKTLLTRLGLGIGDTIQLGEAGFTITAVLAHEPDRVTHLFSLGPRVLIPLERVPQTGLLQAGSRITQVVSVRLAEGESSERVARAIQTTAHAAGIRTLTPEQSQTSIRRFVRRFALFLALTSLLTLLVGGMAMTNAMAAYLHASRNTIAILKLLGAETKQIVVMVLWSTVRMVWLASLAGGIAGVVLPGVLPLFLAGLLPAEAVYHPSPGLAVAGTGLGILFSLFCTAGPLWWIRRLSPIQLFRATAWEEAKQHDTKKNRWMTWLVLLVVGCAAVGVGIWSGESRFGWLFVGGLGGVLLLTWSLTQVCLWGLQQWAPRRFYWKLAIHALLRRGSGSSTVIISFGLGMGLVGAALFLEDNLHQQLVNRIPQRLPSFFFIDIQPDQVTAFQETLRRFVPTPTDAVRLFPTVRGRLAVAHQVGDEDSDQPQAWRKTREYVLTYAEHIPVGNWLVAGQWWSDPTAKEASVEVEMARSLGLRVGDELAFMIQGVTITARIANLRAVRWSDLGLNFFVVLSPAVLQDAPVTYLASVVVPDAQEEPLLAAVTSRLHNVTAIATQTVLASVQELLQHIAQSARLLGGAAVVAGLLVLGVGVVAAKRHRTHEIALYRLLGSTRKEVAQIVAAEFAILAWVATGIGVGIGQMITALAVEGLLDDTWRFNPQLTLSALIGGSVVVFLTGWISSYRELDQPVMTVLQGTAGR